MFAAVLLSTAACAAIAGVSGKEVDACFDGCDGGGIKEGGTDGPSPADNFVPDSPVNVDSGPCDCPKGTHLINGVCASDLPATNLACAAPLQLPDCPLKLALHLCDTDPTSGFIYAPQCTGGSDAGRPSSFFRLGKSPTSKWKLTIVGAQNVARPTIACDEANSPCGARDGGSLTGTTTFTSPSLPDNDSVVVGKADAPGCQDITITVESAP